MKVKWVATMKRLKFQLLSWLEKQLFPYREPSKVGPLNVPANQLRLFGWIRVPLRLPKNRLYEVTLGEDRPPEFGWEPIYKRASSPVEDFLYMVSQDDATDIKFLDSINELKSCPFCGHQPFLENLRDSLHRVAPDHSLWTFSCLDNEGGCNASILGNSPIDCVTRWNRRE